MSAMGEERRVLVVGAPRAYESLKKQMPGGSRWSPVFASGTVQAWTELERGRFDAVIAEYRVSGPSNLLQEVGGRFPTMARVGVAQSLVTRPGQSSPIALVTEGCPAERLEGALRRSCAVHAIIGSVAVRKAVGRIDSLPSVPSVYLRVLELAGDDAASAEDIGAAIETDPALALKVLQVVNSACFGLRQRMVSVQQAVAFLGVELIKGIVLTAQVFTKAEKSRISGFDLVRFQEYSIRVARLAQRFAPASVSSDEAFTAGLVHDIGKLVLALRFGPLYDEALLRIAESGEPAEDVERRSFGATHSEAGAFLLWSWGLPFSVVECVALHHRRDDLEPSSQGLMAAVHGADALWGILGCGESEARLDRALLERAGLSGQLEGWRRTVQGTLDSY